MRLLSFNATRLNHIRKLNVDFTKSVTFITGVNGSGKTSVLTSIIALLSPNFEALAHLSFDQMTVKFELKGRELHVTAKKNQDGEISLSTSDANKPIVFQQFEDDAYSSDSAESRIRYYEKVLSDAIDTDVLKRLSSVPTPMFLGLDRRYRGSLSTRTRVASRRFARRRKRNVFGSSLGDSLMQAIALAEDQYSLVQNRNAQYNGEFVRDLLLGLITIPAPEPFGALEPPTKEDRKLVEQARRAITKFPRVEGITAEDVRTRMEPTISAIDAILKSIPADADLSKLTSTNKSSRAILTSIIQWSGFKSTLGQITKVSGLITEYNDRVSSSAKHIDRYVKLVDEFIGQTGKAIGFDRRGALVVRTHENDFSVEDLSSGEAQIFVLLTHLAFNQDAQEAGVFLIDEPELSLHITWQEMLVNSLLKANESLQYIMATHSPSIIVDRLEDAIDISAFSTTA